MATATRQLSSSKLSRVAYRKRSRPEIAILALQTSGGKLPNGASAQNLMVRCFVKARKA
jgi:L-lactate permease